MSMTIKNGVVARDLHSLGRLITELDVGTVQLLK